MELKYQNEIDNFAFQTLKCPMVNQLPNDLEAYRFSFNPIEHEDNFLPNVVFDRKRGKPFNYTKAVETVRCSRCSSSMYNTLDFARLAWKNLSPQVKENLGYTHLAKGILNNIDGLVTEINQKGHFGFYESNECNPISKFSILEEL